MDELVAKLKVAIERCKEDFEDVVVEYNDVFQHRIRGYDLALDIAMENLKRAHWHFKSVCKKVKHFNNANAVQPTTAEPVSVRPVVANVSEEHNTAAREEMVEGNSNTSASEETVEDN